MDGTLYWRVGMRGKGEGYTVYTRDTRMLIQGQLHLCLRKVHPNTRQQSLMAIRMSQATSS